jgi:hypothetical protein
MDAGAAAYAIAEFEIVMHLKEAARRSDVLLGDAHHPGARV